LISFVIASSISLSDIREIPNLTKLNVSLVNGTSLELISRNTSLYM
jgi:hypothetical protein